MKLLITTKFIVFILLLSMLGDAYGQESRNTNQVTKLAQAERQSGERAKGDAAARSTQAKIRSLSRNIQNLKREVVSLNKDLRIMEEKILFPSNTKYSVFVSLSSGQFFTLESIKLKIDDRLVATHLYSDRQRQALMRGGIQKLYITNLNEGKHTATVFFTGVGPNGRPYKRAKNLIFEKGPGEEYLEIAIGDDGASQEPVFRMKQW